MKKATRFALLEIALTLALALIARDPARAGTAGLPPTLDPICRNYFPENGPGGTVTLIEKGKLILQKSYGFADIERKIPFSEKTLVDLASTSKQFTALAVLMLRERARLALEDPARKYLPELPEFDPKRPIKVGDLLHMTSGLADYMELFPSLEKVTNADIAMAVGKKPLLFPTGSQYEYSNTDYALLGLLVKRASGSELAGFLKANVFDIAGMTSTLVLDSPGTKVPGRAVGYKKASDRWTPHSSDTSIVGDGQVLTSSEDMVLWDRALTEGKLVKKETLDLAFTPGRLDNGEAHDYGAGWVVEDEEGSRHVWHNGSWAGTASYIMRHLTDHWTLIILSNNEDLEIEELASQIEDAVFGDGGVESDGSIRFDPGRAHFAPR